MKNATITGWGLCVPEPVVTNEELSQHVDTNAEWIRSRSGIEERHISHVQNSDMATLAGKRALAAAGLEPDDIDFIIVATCTPDRQIPSSACYVQTKLGANNAAATDINAGCTGFVYGLSLAQGLIATGTASKLLVIGSERLTSYLDLDVRSTAVLFGDGAGAVVLEATDEDIGIQSMTLGSDGAGAPALTATGLGTEFIGTEAKMAIVMDGSEVFKNAVIKMGEQTILATEMADWSMDDIDLVIPHQANLRIIDAVRRRLKVDESMVYVNVQKYGNTSAATIPIALAEALSEGRIQPNDKVILVAFGAGFTWGATAIQWGDRTEPIETTDEQLPDPTEEGIDIMLARQDALHV
jgi:3-oxoacyl-[acyl-carrier-protein] synthase-3